MPLRNLSYLDQSFHQFDRSIAEDDIQRTVSAQKEQIMNDTELEDSKSMLMARLVVDRIQKKWVIQALKRWDKYVDDRADRRANGYESPPTDEECGGMVKKAQTRMQRSAGPGTAVPEALKKELDKDKALEELGETMRVQQEEIIRLNNVAKDDNMRFVAKEYQWKEEKQVLQNRIKILQQKIHRQEETIDVVNQIKTTHIEAVDSQAELFLLGQAMNDAIQDSDIHLDQIFSTLDWLEQIADACFDGALRQQHKLKNCERRFATPAEVRTERLESSLSKQRSILQRLQTDNDNLTQGIENVVTEYRTLQDTLLATKTEMLDLEQQMQVKLRAKDAENEQLLKILQEMDLTYTSKLKDALSVQNATASERIKSNNVIVSQEYENLKMWLKSTLDESPDLSTFKTDLNQHLRAKEAMPYSCGLLSNGEDTQDQSVHLLPWRVINGSSSQKMEEMKKSVTIADAPKVETICNLPPQGEFIGPTLPVHGNALPNKKSTPLPQAPDSDAPTPLVYSEEPERGPVLQSQRAPMPMRSPHISSTAPLARSSPATPESGVITGHRSFQGSPAMNSAIPALQPSPLSTFSGDPQPFAESNIDAIWPEEGKVLHRTIQDDRRGSWKSGQEYPAAPPLPPKYGAGVSILQRQASPRTGEQSKTVLGLVNNANVLRERETSPFHRQREEERARSPFKSPSLMHSMSPSSGAQRAAPVPVPAPVMQRSTGHEQWNASAPDFNLQADLVYNSMNAQNSDPSSINTDWASFVHRQSRTSLESPRMGHAGDMRPQITPASPMHQHVASPSFGKFEPTIWEAGQSRVLQPPAQLLDEIAQNEWTSSPNIRRESSPMLQRRAPSPRPSHFGTSPSESGALAGEIPGNSQSMLQAHPLLHQQFAQFVDEQRKRGLFHPEQDMTKTLLAGNGERGSAPAHMSSGVGVSPENAEVIAREIARLQASRAADAERLKTLMQRKGG